MKRFLLGAVGLAVPFLSGCQIITIPEIYPYPFKADYGDQVNVIMNPEGDIFQRCMNMGGAELIYNEVTGIYTCERVDF